MRISSSSLISSLDLANTDTKNKENTSSTIANALNYTSNSSRAFSHTLDRYGVYDNLKTFRETSTIETMTIFSHRTMDGNYKIETGLYISDPKSGDRYGDFKFYQGRGAKKYQTSQVAKLEFDKHSLNTLSDTYHSVSGATKFLSDLLALRACKDLNTYKNAPELFSYIAPLNTHSNGFLIFPNLPYIDTPSLLNTPTILKDKKEGVAICAYAVHPNQDLSLIEHMKGVAHPETNHFDNTRTAYEIESGTTTKYLSSILDLDTSDIPMLENLCKHTLEHLNNTYSVDLLKDKVQLFFHFPVAEETATLHLHARVNKADHPLNEARSFGLTEVIDMLRSGGSAIDMILARNSGVFYTGAHESVAFIKDIPNKGTADNPYILSLSQPFENATMFRSKQKP